MAGIDGREALRGVEGAVLDLIPQVLTSREWSKLLSDLLERAAFLGDRGLTQRLVGSGAGIGKALHAGVEGGHGDIVNDLLESGASVTARGRHGMTPLHVAARAGKPEMVRLLVLKGAEIDALDDDDWTPLVTAAHGGGDPAVVCALLAAGADVNLRCDKSSKKLPLHMAAYKAGVGVLRALIEHGADVNVVDARQDTALHRATLGNGAEAIDFLVEAGATINARNGVGYTPLHYAGQEKNVEALRCLLSHGADVNTLSSANESVLHVAAMTAGKPGSAAFVDLLLRSGADETIFDRHNKPAARVIGNNALGPFRRVADIGPELGRVEKLLVNAPADRAWRRRGYLAMCRAHPGRLQLRQDTISSSCAFVASAGRSRARNCDGTEAGGGESNERVGGDWAGVMERVLGLQEDGIFRAIVGYL